MNTLATRNTRGNKKTLLELGVRDLELTGDDFAGEGLVDELMDEGLVDEVAEPKKKEEKQKGKRKNEGKKRENPAKRQRIVYEVGDEDNDIIYEDAFRKEESIVDESELPKWCDDLFPESKDYPKVLNNWSIKIVEEIDGFTKAGPWKALGGKDAVADKIGPENVSVHLNFLSNLILKVMNTDEPVLPFDTYQDSALAQYMEKNFPNLDKHILYAYFLQVHQVLIHEYEKRTAMSAQMFVFGPIIDQLAHIYKNLDKCSVECNAAAQMPNRYTDPVRKAPRTDTTVLHKPTYAPMLVTEYKPDEEMPRSATSCADTAKVILETKLAMDHHYERKAGTFANRTIAVAMNQNAVRVFIMEAEIVIEEETPKKRFHKLYRVPGIEQFRTLDICKLISLLLLRFETDYWKLFNDATQKLQDKYKNIPVSATPKKSLKDRRKAGEGAEEEERVTALSSSTNKPSTKIHRIDDSTIIKETSLRRSVEGKPIEVYALEQLSKFNEFVKLKDWSASDHSYQLKLEVLHEIDFAALDTQTKVVCMHQALVAVQRMHSCGIIHRDIKTRNCMQRKDKSVQLVMIDFDLAVMCEDGQALPSAFSGRPAGTSGYIAPEMYANKFYDSRIDIFSCGIMFAEWHTGVLYHKFGRDSVSRVIQDLNLERGQECKIKNLILRMVCKNRDERITVEDALASDVFKTVNS